MGKGKKCRFYVDIQSLQDEVTGSNNLVTISYPDGSKEKLVVDFGLYQGSDTQMSKNSSVGFRPENLVGIILTHAHVDHCGRLPLLYKKGASCRTYMTGDTMKIAEKLLANTTAILTNSQTQDETIFDICDFERTIKEFRECEFNQFFQVTEKIKVKFIKNEHVPGAASVYIVVSYPEEKDITLFFSGDYNITNMFSKAQTKIPAEILETPISAMILESTYGARKKSDSVGYFENSVAEFAKQGKDIIIPAFAFCRFQTILLELKKLQDQEKLSKSIPIFMDGGLGVDLTFLWQYLDSVEVKEFMPQSLSIVSDRKGLMNSRFQKIIVTTSGMGNFGPAREYIPHYIQKENAVIFLTGYVASGSTARHILDAEMHEVIPVCGIVREKLATVVQTSEFSSHARHEQLVELVQQFDKINFLILNHGEEESKTYLAKSCSQLSNVKNIGIIDGRTDFRISCYGIVKTFSI